MNRTTFIIDLLASLHGVDRLYRGGDDALPGAIDLMTAAVIEPHPDHPDGETLMLEYPWGLRTSVRTSKLLEMLLARDAQVHERVAITDAGDTVH